MAKLSSASQGVTKTIDPASPGKAGEIKQYGGTTAPSGYVLCDGQELAEADYPQLFANIGSKYNTGGETASHFRVPNGPMKTSSVDLDVDVSGIGGGVVDFATGYCFQDVLGKWFAYITIDIGANAGSSARTFNIAGLSYRTFQGLSATDGSTGVVLNAMAKTSGDIEVVSNTSYNDIRVSGTVELTSKPTDAFVGADSRFSTFDEALESAPIIKLYDDSTSAVSVSVAEATAATAGVVKTNRVLTKSSDTVFTTTTNGILSLSSVPKGKYRVTIGSNYFYMPVPDDQAIITPQLNNANIITPGDSIAVWVIGVNDNGATSYETYINGMVSTLILDFPNETNSFDLDISISGSGQVGRPVYILEKLENVSEITTEWD